MNCIWQKKDSKGPEVCKTTFANFRNKSSNIWVKEGEIDSFLTFGTLPNSPTHPHFHPYTHNPTQTNHYRLDFSVDYSTWVVNILIPVSLWAVGES